MVSLSSVEKKRSLSRYDEEYYFGELAKLFCSDDYHVASCSYCRHVFYEKPPAPDQLSAMYRAHSRVLDKKGKHKGNFDDLKKRHAEKYQILYSLIKQCSGQPTLLDYGGGSGIWSIIAADVGFNVVCYEPHSERVDERVKHLNNWSDVAKMNFDVILCNQVLEHVINPVETLQDIYDVCTPESILFSVVPNAGKQKLESMAKSWPYDGTKSHVIAPFQHLHGFSQDSFIKLHEIAGFKPAVREMMLVGSWGSKSIAALITSKLSLRLSRCAFLFKLRTV